MSYTDLYQKKPLKIPSVLAVVIVAAVSFFITNFFVSDPQSTKAVKKTVISLDVTNLSSSKANIVWRTSEKERGIVLYGNSATKLTNVATDERDSAKDRQKYFNHSAILTNLLPNTEYFYSLSNEKELLSINDETIFTFRTAPVENRINSLKPAYGIVQSATGIPQQNVLVILKHEGSVPLSSISKISGEWLMPLNGLLNAKTLSLSTPALSSNVKISLYDEKGNVSTVTAPIQLVSPVSSSIRIGESYSLPEDSTVLGTSVSTEGKTLTGSNLNFFKVSYPMEDAIIPVGSPLIKGVSSPLTTISITIYNESDSIVFSKQTIADSKGEWKITVSQTLPAGLYSLVARSSMTSARAIVKNFTVIKSGEKVLGEATGSAELTSTPTPATPSGTMTPTVSAEPTEITPTLPATGGSVSYLMYSSAALIILGLGLMFVF